MKQMVSLLVITAFVLFSPAVRSQEPVKMDEVVIRDSTGAVCPPEVWRKLVARGKYEIRLAPDRKSGELHRVTVADIQQKIAAMPKPSESASFKTGERIAPFNEKDMNGERFNLREMQGKVVVLNFWYINCGPCMAEIPALYDLVEAFKENKEVVFIGIALDEKWDLSDFLKKTAFTYHIVPNGRSTANKYGIRSYPTNVVLDKQGRVLFHTSGFSVNTPFWLKKSIETALKSENTQ